jgi:hypothetical protein
MEIVQIFFGPAPKIFGPAHRNFPTVLIFPRETIQLDAYLALSFQRNNQTLGKGNVFLRFSELSLIS